MDQRAQIERGTQNFVATFRALDGAAMAALYTADGQLLPANSDFVSGTAAIARFWQGVFDLGIRDSKLETIDVEVHGDTAIEIGRYELFAAGGVAVDNGKYVVVWKQVGGTWKMHRDIWTTSQPAPAPAA